MLALRPAPFTLPPTTSAFSVVRLRASTAVATRPGYMPAPYCNVTSTSMTPLPLARGSSALPTTAPSIRLRSVPLMA